MLFTPLSFGLVLYFDGSLRFPRDAGFPTKGLARMASCGAVLFKDNNNSTTSLAAIGSKRLPIIPDMTSADVEYDGLLFGLNHVLNNSECVGGSKHKSNDVLVVRGDCKAIMDQWNGKAAPRKLLPKHELALMLIEKIGKQVTFEHVNREENVLCDAICASVMHIAEQRQLARYREEVASLAQSTSSDTLQNQLSDLLRDTITSEKSLLRYSIRPQLYLEAMDVARQLHDGKAMEYAGRQLITEQTHWKRQNSLMNMDLMAAQGILWQVQGLEWMGNDKQAKRKLHKHRFLLDSFGSHDEITNLFQAACESLDVSATNATWFCNNLGDGDCEALGIWHEEANAQDDNSLRQGYWINR